MTILELHFAGDNGHDEIERFDIKEFSFAVVQNLIEEHWDHVKVSNWTVADTEGTEDAQEDIVRVEVYGKYVGEDFRYFDEAFEEQFKSKMQRLDPEFDFDKHQKEIKNTSEVYIVSSYDNRYCVLTTNDLIVSEGCIFASPKASETLKSLFGDMRDSGRTLGRDDVKVITEPRRIAEIIKKIDGIELQEGVDDELRFQLDKLQWDLKQALFQDYHNEMINALVGEPARGALVEEANGEANRGGVLRSVWRVVYEERLVHDLVDTLWITFQNAVWLTIPLMLLDLSPTLLALSVFNDKVVNFLNRVQTVTGVRLLTPVVSILQTVRAWWLLLVTGGKIFIVAFAIGSYRRRRSTAPEQNVTVLKKIIRCGICVLQDTTLFFVTMVPPLCMEYQSQMKQLENDARD